MNDVVIQLEKVWKVFGPDADKVMEIIKRDNLSKEEVLEKHSCVVGVSDCSFEVKKGEIFCVMGLSGSGKSTMIRHLNRLHEPTSGNINILGNDMTSLNDHELREMRASNIGMVFQHMALLPHISVLDNVAFPLKIKGIAKAERWGISQHCLDLVNLTGYEDRYPNELSGGMQQRVGLARALASDPEVLLMDEPFSALDPLIRRQLQDQFMELSSKLGKTTVFITHDLDEAIRIGNRIAIMKDGKIIQIGTPEDIVTNPIDDYVSDFVEGISTLKLIFARTIMKNINHYQLQTGEDLSKAPTVSEETDLSVLIDISTTTDQPIIVQDKSGKNVGVINKTTLLKGIKGGKA